MLRARPVRPALARSAAVPVEANLFSRLARVIRSYVSAAGAGRGGFSNSSVAGSSSPSCQQSSQVAHGNHNPAPLVGAQRSPTTNHPPLRAVQ